MTSSAKRLHGVISILDAEHSAQVEALWDELEAHCGLRAIRQTPIPHFSWHIAEDYAFDDLEKALRAFAAQSTPFIVRTVGLGIFSGASPVVYIPVLRAPDLCAYQTELWAATSEFGRGINSKYAPEVWMPHITLASRDVTVESLSCVMQLLGDRSFDWEIEIDNLAAVYQEQGQVGKLKCKYSFAG